MTPELILLNKYVKQIFPFIISINSVDVVKRNSFTPEKCLDVNIYLSATHFCEMQYNWVTEQTILKQMNDKTYYIFKSIINDWDGKTINFRFLPDVNLTFPTILEGFKTFEEMEEECPF